MSSIKTTQIDGDVSVGRNVSIGGNTTIQGNGHIKGGFKVDGWLEAKNIKGANKGIFTTVEKLREAYPRPHDGWWAIVGRALPSPIYVGDGGAWVATGENGGNPTVDIKQFLEEDVNEVVTTALSREINDIIGDNVRYCQQLSMQVLERGGMSVQSDGTFSKFDGQYTSRLRLAKGSMHLSKGSKFLLGKGARLYVGGIYDDGSPIKNNWVLSDGGEYYCAKSGVFTLILMYADSREFSQQSSDENLASLLAIIHESEFNNNVDERLKNVEQRPHLDCISVSTIESFTKIKRYLKWNGALRIVNDGFMPFLSHSTVSIKMKEGSEYFVALCFRNISGKVIYDSSWKKEIEKDVPNEVVDGWFWFKRVKDGQDIKLSDTTIDVLPDEIASLSVVLRERNVDTEVMSLSMTMERLDNLFYMPHRSIQSVCHQGYSVTEQYYGNSRLSSYVAAAQKGFDYGETDLKFTSDNVPVCCHDNSFINTHNNHSTIVISEHTYAELKTYGYCGETIASLDEVLQTCKTNGLGLYIDHVYTVDSDIRWSRVFDAIKKYAMEDRVVWLCQPNDKIVSFFEKSRFSIVCSSLSDTLIETLKILREKYKEIGLCLDVDYHHVSVDDLVSYNEKLPAGCYIELWTIDDITLYRRYIPYVSAITSNKLSEVMLNKS